MGRHGTTIQADLSRAPEAAGPDAAHGREPRARRDPIIRIGYWMRPTSILLEPSGIVYRLPSSAIVQWSFRTFSTLAERVAIAMAKAGNNKVQAAKLLSVSRGQLYSLLRKHSLTDAKR
jgi:hypothetical protein